MGRLTVLKQIAADLASQFGPDCEVVIHDLKTSEPEHSIVYIVNGHVTNRDIGDGPSNAVFDAIRNQEKGATPEDHTGYLMKTADGKILKCSTSNDLLDHLIEESVALVGKPVPLMNKEDKVTAIQFLNDAGAFLITKSGDKVANYFGISKYTLYSYIDVNK